jgi:hypothetical protein
MKDVYHSAHFVGHLVYLFYGHLVPTYILWSFGKCFPVLVSVTKKNLATLTRIHFQLFQIFTLKFEPRFLRPIRAQCDQNCFGKVTKICPKLTQNWELWMEYFHLVFLIWDNLAKSTKIRTLCENLGTNIFPNGKNSPQSGHTARDVFPLWNPSTAFRTKINIGGKKGLTRRFEAYQNLDKSRSRLEHRNLSCYSTWNKYVCTG